MSKARRAGEGDPSATRTDAAPVVETGPAVLDGSPFEGDLEADLAAKPGRAKPRPATYLVAGIIAVAGFIGGVQAHKTWGAEETGTGGMPTASGQRQGGGTGGFGGGGFGGGVTAGTVTKVKDGVITLKTSDGESVEVKTSGDTTITLSENGEAADLKSGASVVVRGETGEDGTVTATSVSEGSGTSGFPGGGGGLQAPSGN
ncbi:hypothetical protein EDD29_6516 [Actinocorallia herbida]|uniref:DUF5666 domain-containing protein n=1 Tax=Actinocorallia herbida TaxID=58109 RepID=A0A3N1D5M9_9ACTN|nr:hypothetical protein [Actinocorallia herbida]ROO88834.1 hypothetical protein EDD29_6516 [Actinocorallia herbida]